MKSIFCAVAVVAALAASSVKAGEISKSSLAKMGLGGLQVMSDEEGTQVRGMGTYASVTGSSWANYHKNGTAAGARNSYSAGSNKKYGEAGASGGSLSFAGAVKYNSSQHGPYSSSSIRISAAVSGGGAHASAY